MNLTNQAPCPQGKSYPDLSEIGKHRFWNKVDKSPGNGPWGTCWLWTGARHQRGYGQIRIMYRSRFVHIVSYLMLRGSYPDGFDLHHLCNTPACVNPDHLKPLAPEDHALIGNSPLAKFARQTHCKWGHELTPENVYRWKGKGRLCKKCRAYHNKYRNKEGRPVR